MIKISIIFKKLSPTVIIVGIILFLISSFLLGNYSIKFESQYPPDPTIESIGFPIQFYHSGETSTYYAFGYAILDAIIWIGIVYGFMYLLRFFSTGIEKHKEYTKKQ